MPAGPLVHGGNIRKQKELERVMGIDKFAGSEFGRTPLQCARRAAAMDGGGQHTLSTARQGRWFMEEISGSNRNWSG